MTSLKKVLVFTGAGSRFSRSIVKEILNDSKILPVFITSNITRLLNLPEFQTDIKLDIREVNLSKVDEIKSTFNKIILDYNRIDVLINNAALNTVPGFDDFISNSNDERIKESFVINVVSALWCIKYAMKKSNNPKMIFFNILSTRALTAHSRHIDYFASKAALYNATKSLSNDYPHHSFVNVMSGNIDTGKGGINPIKIWQAIHDCIFKKSTLCYQELYFMKLSNYFFYLIKYYINHFLNSKRISI